MKFASHHGIVINGAKTVIPASDFMQKTHIGVYLTDTFIEVLSKFEQFVSKYDTRLSTNVNIRVYDG